MGDELMPWHKNYLLNIEYDRVDLVKEGANSKAFIKLLKSKGGSTMTFEELLAKLTPEHAEIVKTAMKAKEDAMTEAVAKAKTAEEALQVAQEEVQKLKDAEPVTGTTEEEILKSVKDPAVKALLETQIAKAKAAEDLVRKAREEALSTEAIAKAKEVPNIGAEDAVLADVYKKLKQADASLCDEVFGIFKAASALIAEGGSLSEIGKSVGGNTSVEGSVSEDAAWGKIEKAAVEIAKTRNISKSAAVGAVIKENPDLYNAYLKAQQG